MENFTYIVPTAICFGKGQIDKLAEMKKRGSKALLCYGGGSIKRMGLYDRVLGIMADNGIEVFELSGIDPNPRIESVREGVKLCKENGIEMILAVGGGSTIDCGKVVAAGACYDGDPWDLVLNPGKITAALPIFTVLTLSATGTEMNGNAVISDMSKNEKWGTGSLLVKPVLSVLDPTYTFSVSKKQTAAGTADMMSHTFENYFNNIEGADLQEQFALSILKTCVKYGPIALAEPDNYDARANLMWASSHAINGLCSCGCPVAWCIHPIEHERSAFYDITHGEGLAIMTCAWMRYILNEKTAVKIARYGREVWGITEEDNIKAAEQTIEKTEEFFFVTMGMPKNLREVGITDEKYFDIMAQKSADGCVGSFVPLSKEDIVKIYRMAL